MTSGAHGLSPESEALVEEVIESFQNSVSREELHFLLTDHEAWDRFVAEATLSREEADTLREALNELEGAMDMEVKDKLARERFLSVFPQLKLDLEERIRKLRELADDVDRLHKNCTISKIVAGSAGAASGILTILGLGLAPITAGASLTLLATGAGLGAAAAVTEVSTSIVEYSSESSAKAQASQLTSAEFDKGDVFAKVLRDCIPQISSLTGKCIQALQNIAKNARAIKLARVKPRLVVNARRVMTARSVSVRSGRQVKKAFGGTALAMSKGARIMGAATAGLFLAMDVYNLVKDSSHLKEGAKAESAEELRQDARELERKLEELTKIYESLTEGPTP
ncbi:apolipoprotein L3-like isoform X2 [Ursus americanus]|uniref:Apolipoprotein L3 isoform X1 n=1 Tax=Ursus maritimus TaxID=29073 RepID=A0A384DAM3_URSMA|nr:apolipoprotein L3 isoform X1 [Ursus maritimus]XP_040493391.1 apolipoprotein L3 isoform X1 [Ursus maritimus]XP_040493392.1 apolipoprotein L3 isoform X1 [Ursus maritimus]XP_045635460.1 apolipoprotein L3-like isoform X2 [Ursus americanus]XP_045635461.1 apolipoprotein L3-like isoform X2 [Ursus americanus]XP_045635463.1 apolipoprotein L3-like isoform X2 [Ursus americanus]XP_045635464.1 apolipoprotein L3-like isoform X2 [Ursus americanus]XP_045635465.1 apolipoprotein L3-like isoform X2 [Ursus a